MTHLSKTILKTVIESLGLNFDTKYLAEFNNCHGYMRINHYSSPELSDDQEIEGLSMHTDMSCITVVCQDEIGGLQIRSKEGQWMEISPKENALVVNIGDLLQLGDELVVDAPEEVVGEGNSRVYKPFVCGDYVKFRENSEKGMNNQDLGCKAQEFEMKIVLLEAELKVLKMKISMLEDSIGKFDSQVKLMMDRMKRIHLFIV
ncbi:2-oxoglutarate (2OG) and Fe(II)-dependent oxygenase superfamily protein, partial [Striga asiatica]